MPPALIAAGVVAAGSIGAAAIGSSSSRSAANTAATAQTQTAAQNNALLLDLRNRDEANFAPYSATGLQAMGTLNGLLYGNRPQPQQPQAQAQPYSGPAPVNALYGHLQQPPAFRSQYMIGDNQNSPWEQPYSMGAQTFGMQPPQQGVTTPAPNAQDAWEQFRNGSQYQWRFDQGMNALNQGLAGRGAQRSGAAEKAAIRYGQGFASNELGNFINLLQGQQNLGFGGAQALAGVSNNYGNQVTANNNNAADAMSNAALLRGQANQALYGGVANALGNFASSFNRKGY
jgi:hypothetical protein